MKFHKVEKLPYHKGTLRVVVRNKNYKDSLNVLFQDIEDEDRIVYIPTYRSEPINDLMTHDWIHIMDSETFLETDQAFVEYRIVRAMKMIPDWIIFESLQIESAKEVAKTRGTYPNKFPLYADDKFPLFAAELGHNVVVVIESDSKEEAFSILVNSMAKNEQVEFRLPLVFAGIYMDAKRYSITS